MSFSATEEYYRVLLEESERLLREATEMLDSQASTIEDLMKLLKKAAVDLNNLEDFMLDDKDIRVSH